MSTEVDHHRRRVFGAAALVIATSQLGMIGLAHAQGGKARLSVEGDMPSLGGASAWLNSSPLKADSLRGKVVLVNFCTYSCINWLRTLPYVRAWNDKY